jgi:hypothetical protein
LEAKSIAIAIIFVLVGVVIIATFITLFKPPDASSSFTPTTMQLGTPTAEECVSGMQESCWDENRCPGTRTCEHGTWSSCAIPNECTPGEKEYCATGGCANGVQKCNNCGQWGPCLPQ